MDNDAPKPNLVERWARKFGSALRGIVVAVREEASFVVHVPVGIAVLVLGVRNGVGQTEWLLLALCVAVVIAAELFNSAIERLATAITTEIDPAIRDALDIASGAVLATAIGAAVVGLVILF